eukprot:TRINITY_DN11643_c0_g2_i1.p1 TRINITY_DN11643_c0_g2~~TRINITY_DN11643_c0_g2_i1.p1  ORF type:complete len:2474 (+),score=478.98 TRINITY_DN11643_c0_g2_i1:99-7520(+)
MGAFLCTQLQWERERRHWLLAKGAWNDDALYQLYVELCELYLRWFRMQDLEFEHNNDIRGEEATLLRTRFSRPLVFYSQMPLAVWCGGHGSGSRQAFVETQLRRKNHVEQGIHELASRMGPSKSTAAHRRRVPGRSSVSWFKGAQAGETPPSERPRPASGHARNAHGNDSHPNALSMPEYFWRQYTVTEQELALISVERVDTQHPDGDFGPPPPPGAGGPLPLGNAAPGPRGQQGDGEPCYQMYESADTKDHLRCVVWTLQHAVQHLALLLTVLEPDFAIDPIKQGAHAVSTPFALEAVRRGACRSYLFLDHDYAVCLPVATVAIHTAVVGEMRRMVEGITSLVGGELTGGAEGCIARGWRLLVAGASTDYPQASIDGYHTGPGVAAMRQAAAARVGVTGEPLPNETECTVDPARAAAAGPLRLLNDLLTDPAALRRTGESAPVVAPGASARQSEWFWGTGHKRASGVSKRSQALQSRRMSQLDSDEEEEETEEDEPQRRLLPASCGTTRLSRQSLMRPSQRQRKPSAAAGRRGNEQTPGSSSERPRPAADAGSDGASDSPNSLSGPGRHSTSPHALSTPVQARAVSPPYSGSQKPAALNAQVVSPMQEVTAGFGMYLGTSGHSLKSPAAQALPGSPGRSNTGSPSRAPSARMSSAAPSPPSRGARPSALPAEATTVDTETPKGNAGHLVSPSSAPLRPPSRGSVAGTSRHGKSTRRRQRAAKVDLSGELSDLTPAEIVAALFRKVQQEEMDEEVTMEANVASARRRRSRPADQGTLTNVGAMSPAEKEQLWREHLIRQADPATAEALDAEDRKRQSDKEEAAAQLEREWAAECSSTGDDDDFRAFHPAWPKRLVTPVQPTMPVLGRTVTDALAHRLQVGTGSASPTNQPKAQHVVTPEYETARIAADRPSAIRRLAYAMLWQQLELLVFSVCAARLRQLHAVHPLTAAAAARELAAVAKCCGQDRHSYPAHLCKWVGGEPNVPPWRAAAGELGEAEVVLHDSGDEESGAADCWPRRGRLLRVVAKTTGWYVLSTINNQTVATLESPRMTRLSTEQEAPVSAPYASLWALLWDNSEHWRAFDSTVMRAAAGSPVQCAPSPADEGSAPVSAPGRRRSRRRSSASPNLAGESGMIRAQRTRRASNAQPQATATVRRASAAGAAVLMTIRRPSTASPPAALSRSVTPHALSSADMWFQSATSLGSSQMFGETEPMVPRPPDSVPASSPKPGQHRSRRVPSAVPTASPATTRLESPSASPTVAHPSPQRREQQRAAGERRRKEQVAKLRTQQQAIADGRVDWAPEDAQNSDFGSDAETSPGHGLSPIPASLPPDGLDILRQGPPRPPPAAEQPRRPQRAQRSVQRHPSKAKPAARPLPIDTAACTTDSTFRSPISSPSQVQWRQGDETDAEEERQNIVHICRRSAYALRDWGAACTAEELARGMATDMLSLGIPDADAAIDDDPDQVAAAEAEKREQFTAEDGGAMDDGFPYLLLPTPPQPQDLTEKSSRVQFQWISFIRNAGGQGRLAQLLFALRSLAGADLSLPANQFTLIRFNGHIALAGVLLSQRDVRLRLDAARILLTVAQNVEAAKQLAIPQCRVIAACSALLHEYCSPQAGAPTAGTALSPQQKLKSTQLSRMAADALSGRPQLKQQGREAQAAAGSRHTHDQLQSVCALLLASLALSCGRARIHCRALGVDGAAVTLLARFDGRGGEQVPVALAHLLRALVALRNCELRGLAGPGGSSESGVEPPPVRYIAGLAPAIARQLSAPSLPVYAGGEAFARLRTHQALCGILCLFRRSIDYCNDAAAHHIAPYIASAQRDVAALIRQARPKVIDRTHLALREEAARGADSAAGRLMQQQQESGSKGEDEEPPPEVSAHFQRRKPPEQMAELRKRKPPPLYTPETPAGLLGCCRVLVITWQALESLAWHPACAEQLINVVPEAMELAAALARPLQLPSGSRRGTKVPQPGPQQRRASKWMSPGSPLPITAGLGAFPALSAAPGAPIVPPPVDDSGSDEEQSGCLSPRPKVVSVVPDHLQLTLLLLGNVCGFLAEIARHPNISPRALIGASHGAVATLSRLLLCDHVLLGRALAAMGHWGPAVDRDAGARSQPGGWFSPALAEPLPASHRMDRLILRIKEQAAACLSRLAAHRPCLSVISDLALHSMLFELRRGGTGAVAPPLCNALCFLAGAPEVRRRLAARGPVLTLWGLLRAASWETREAAAEALRAFMLPRGAPTGKAEEGKKVDSVGRRVAQIVSGDVAVLHQLLTAPPPAAGSPRARAASGSPRQAGRGAAPPYSALRALCQLCAAVCHCAEQPVVAVLWAEPSLVPRLVDLVDSPYPGGHQLHGREAEETQALRASAAHCLWQAACQPNGGSALLAADAAGRVAVRLGWGGKSAAEGDRYACMMLRELCSRHPEACAEAIDMSAAAPALARLLSAVDPALQEAAASTLASLRRHQVANAQKEADRTPR